MKKRAVFMIIVLSFAVAVGWDFQNIAMAVEQPAVEEVSEPEMDNDSIYAAEEDADTDLSEDEEVISGGDVEEGEPISPDGEVGNETEE